MKKSIFIFLFLFIVSTVSYGKVMYPDSATASNSVELGVEGIDRICPTGLWDHWIFREVEYDKDSNTVLWVIQSSHSLKSLNKNTLTEQDVKEITTEIVTNVIEGYNELKKNPKVNVDGDFMLYLGLGTLLKEMEKNKATLQIALLYPDRMNVAIKDIPMTLNSSEIKQMMKIGNDK